MSTASGRTPHIVESTRRGAQIHALRQDTVAALHEQGAKSAAQIARRGAQINTLRRDTGAAIEKNRGRLDTIESTLGPFGEQRLDTIESTLGTVANRAAFIDINSNEIESLKELIRNHSVKIDQLKNAIERIENGTLHGGPSAMGGHEQGGNGQGGTASRRVVRRVVRRGGEVISDEAFPSGRRVVRRGGAKKTRKRGGSKRKKKRKTKY